VSRCPAHDCPGLSASLTPSEHLLHLVIALFTCGLWAPAYVLIVLARIAAPKCKRCGRHKADLVEQGPS